ncbi:hypothetical protein [Streptosporangium sp. NPDC049644]|uniref:hypothetical protein n=1 Tax=Streptosporangium sp. NPDC049644 TaxID=3155507 RepID=UPI00343FEA78
MILSTGAGATCCKHLILTPFARDKGRRYFKHYQGDVGIDATVIPTWAKPPRVNKGLASTEITAGWHYSAGAAPPTFGYSATLATATRTRSTLDTYPQPVLGLVIDTPHNGAMRDLAPEVARYALRVPGAWPMLMSMLPDLRGGALGLALYALAEVGDAAERLTLVPELRVLLDGPDEATEAAA